MWEAVERVKEDRKEGGYSFQDERRGVSGGKEGGVSVWAWEAVERMEE